MQETKRNVTNENDLQRIKELRLMHDFNCKDAKDMVNPILAEEVRYLKGREGGQNQMCRLLEEMRNEAAEEATYNKAVSTALKMLARGRDSVEEIAEMTDLPLEEVQKLADEQTV